MDVVHGFHSLEAHYTQQAELGTAVRNVNIVGDCVGVWLCSRQIALRDPAAMHIRPLRGRKKKKVKGVSLGCTMVPTGREMDSGSPLVVGDKLCGNDRLVRGG